MAVFFFFVDGYVPDVKFFFNTACKIFLCPGFNPSTTLGIVLLQFAILKSTISSSMNFEMDIFPSESRLCWKFSELFCSFFRCESKYCSIHSFRRLDAVFCYVNKKTKSRKLTSTVLSLANAFMIAAFAESPSYSKFRMCFSKFEKYSMASAVVDVPRP